MLALLLLVGALDATPLPTRIQDVTVYGSTALVHRAGTVAESGSFLLAGLPAGDRGVHGSDREAMVTVDDVQRQRRRARRSL